jgi:hypothetical protein
MPTWISTSLLPLVYWLDINVHQVSLEDIQVLGTLPALRTLFLSSDVDMATEEERAEERSFMLSTDAFPRATVCLFQNVIFAPYMFPPGAMPVVRHLDFGLLVSDILSDGDWELVNLPSLKYVSIKLLSFMVRKKAARGILKRRLLWREQWPTIQTILGHISYSIRSKRTCVYFYFHVSVFSCCGCCPLISLGFLVLEGINCL